MTIAGTSTPHSVACVRYETKTENPAARIPVSAEASARAQFVAETTGQSLIRSDAGILAVGSGKSLDSPGDAALIVYTDKAKGFVSVPQTLDGLRTQVIATDAAAFARDQQSHSPATTTGIHLSANVLAGASAVVREYAPQLLRDPAIFGVGVTQSQDNASEPALLVLVDMAQTPQSTPETIGGLRVRYMKLHPFHITQSKFAGASHASSCALRGMRSVGNGRARLGADPFPSN
jgi:hypothetical protein